MISRSHAQLVSQYNQWMNQKLYAASAQLDGHTHSPTRARLMESLDPSNIGATDIPFMPQFTTG